MAAVDKLLPIKRHWISADPAAAGSSEHSFAIVSYNILADCHVTPDTYPYLLEGYRTMDERHPQLMMELSHHSDADIICLQEVNGQYFQETLHPALAKLGYEGIHCNKAHGIDEGSATFYKKSRFDLETHQEVYFKDQVQEIAFAVNKLVDIAGDKNSALILCGDFNTRPTMPAYQLLQDGRLSEESIQALSQFKIALKDDSIEEFTLVDVMSECFKHPVPNLRSAYKQIMGSEVPFSQFHDTVGLAWKEKHQPGFHSESSDKRKGPHIQALDYIWFSSQTLDCEGALQMVDKAVIDSLYACPNEVFPSDHQLMKARFQFK